MQSDDAKPAVVRQQLLDAVAAAGIDSSGILFEPDETTQEFRPTRCTAGVQVSPNSIHFPRSGLLARWLRVNQGYLPIPDSYGVFHGLPVDDQTALRQSKITGCIALVHERRLVAWLGLIDKNIRDASAPVPRFLAEASIWATRLAHADEQWQEEVKVQAVARSNRLTAAGQMAASLAHEIRNPLAAVRSGLQSIVDQDAPPQEHRRLIVAALDEIDRITGTMTRLLALGQLRTTHEQSVDLQAIAQDAVRFCATHVRRHGVAITSSGPPAMVEGDPFELRQVVVNLILNACQALDQGGNIRITTAIHARPTGGQGIVLRVSDSGPGIPAHVLPRVFDPFFSTKADGGGLGLAICRDIVERHGGQIDLASEIGVGTVATLRFA